MKYRRILVLAVAIAAGISVIGRTPWEPSARATQQDAEPRTDDEENLHVRYAKAYLSLAQLELQRVLNTNRRSPRTYSPVLIERLRSNVDVAQAQMQVSLTDDTRQLHAIHLREREAALKIAESRHANALAANERRPGTIGETDIERLRLAAEVARLGLAKAQDPAHVRSPEAHTQWQLEQLREDVLRLQIRMEELSQGL